MGGMQGVKMDMQEFRRHGGTELAPMSTTKERAVAAKYANGRDSVIFSYKTQALTTGVELQFLSVYPKEREYLYPPGTFLAFKKEKVVNGVRIITVKPQMP